MNPVGGVESPYRGLRWKLLRELYAQTGGDVAMNVNVAALVKATNISRKEITVAADQLAEANLARWKVRTEDGGFIHLTIQGVERAEAMDDPEDIVEQISKSARRSPWTAPLIIGFIVLAAALSAASSVISILQNLGWIAKP